MEIRKFRSASIDDTHGLASHLAVHLEGGDVLGLTGDLGSGKTTFVQGLAKALQVDPKYLITSPTFSLVQEYPCKKGILVHMDFYRLENSADAESLGLDQYFNSMAICAIEWCDQVREALPTDILEIQFSWCSEGEREISFVSHGSRSNRLMESCFDREFDMSLKRR